MTKIGNSNLLMVNTHVGHDTQIGSRCILANNVMLAGHIGATPAIGWRVRRLSRVDVDAALGALGLSPAPAAARWLSEPSGSFGGLRLPSNVAMTSNGDVLLLDPATGEIRRFDPCECRFITVPCVARLVEPRAECAPSPAATSICGSRERIDSDSTSTRNFGSNADIRGGSTWHSRMSAT